METQDQSNTPTFHPILKNDHLSIFTSLLHRSQACSMRSNHDLTIYISNHYELSGFTSSLEIAMINRVFWCLINIQVTLSAGRCNECTVWPVSIKTHLFSDTSWNWWTFMRCGGFFWCLNRKIHIRNLIIQAFNSIKCGTATNSSTFPFVYLLFAYLEVNIPKDGW